MGKYKKQYPGSKNANKRTYKKAKRVWKSKGTFWDKAKSLSLIGVKALLGLNTETKYVDTATAAYTPTTSMSGAITINQTAIAQGTTSSTRTGSSIRITNYRIKGMWINPAGNLLNSTVRVLIVNWGRTPASTISPSILLQSPNDVNSLRNLDSTGSFRILSDRTYQFAPVSTGDAQQVIPFNFEWAPKNHHMQWVDSDTAGTLSNIINGVVYVYFLCDQATAANFPYLSVFQRVKFVDN